MAWQTWHGLVKNHSMNTSLVNAVAADKLDRVSISDGGRNCSFRSSRFLSTGYRYFFLISNEAVGFAAVV
jgi:hypothetical protein